MAVPVYDYRKVATARDAAVALGINDPGTSGAVVSLTELPDQGSIIRPDGTPLQIDDSITGAMLAQLRYKPGELDAPGFGRFGYSIDDGRAVSTGSVDVATVHPSEQSIFSADDGVHGRELWLLNSDRSVELLADITPGPAGSDPSNFFEFNGSVYFTVFLPGTAQELWRYNADGTVELVEDINPFTGVKGPSYFSEFDGAYYFNASDGLKGAELWRLKADGTVELVADIAPGADPSAPRYFKEFNDNLYFTATDPENGRELWRLDGNGSVEMIESSAPGAGGSAPADLMVFNDALYFSASILNNGRALWRVNADESVEEVSDSSRDGPRYTYESKGSLYFDLNNEYFRIDSDGIVETIDRATFFSHRVPYDGYEFEGARYFSHYYPNHPNYPSIGRELWRENVDGTRELVEDINPGRAHSEPSGFFQQNGTLYFTATSGSAGLELHYLKEDGSVGLAGDINTLTTGSSSYKFVEFEDALYFAATDAVHGRELWRLTEGGSTELVVDINPGADSSNPSSIWASGGNLYFRAHNGIDGNQTFYLQADGTIEVVEKLYRNPADLLNLPNYHEFDGAIFFRAWDPDSGIVRLARQDSEGVVEFLENDQTGAGHFDIRQIFDFNDQLYLFAYDLQSYRNGLWQVGDDGVANLVVDFSGFHNSHQYLESYILSEFDGAMYFLAFGDQWVGNVDPILARLNTDGTVETLWSLPNTYTQFTPQLFEIGDHRFFQVTHSAGMDLFRIQSGGTVERVEGLGSEDAWTFLNNFTELNGSLFFSVDDAVVDQQIMRITEDGTIELVGEFSSGLEYNLFHEFNGVLYFNAKNEATGEELWRVSADGVAELVQDINPGAGDSEPSNFLVFNNALFFTVVESDGDFALWRVDSNGLAERLQTIDAVPEDFRIFGPTELGDAVYFSADGLGVGRELWRITADSKLELVEDINTATYGSEPEGVLPFRWELPDGSEGNDVLISGDVDEEVFGFSGDDFIDGGLGDDRLQGGLGDDVLNGGDGYDLADYTDASVNVSVTLRSTKIQNTNHGADQLISIERVETGGGNDTIMGSDVANLLSGGRGNDDINGFDGDDTIFGGGGADHLYGSGGNDVVFGEQGSDFIRGNDGDDRISGGYRHDILLGGDGNDSLNGDAQDDRLFGEDGDDFLNGGSGHDVLRGGADSDTFVFAKGNDIDRVRDWQDGTDMIDLSDFGFADANEALSNAYQQGSNVRFVLNHRDHLVIENEVLANITGADLILM